MHPPQTVSVLAVREINRANIVYTPNVAQTKQEETRETFSADTKIVLRRTSYQRINLF